MRPDIKGDRLRKLKKKYLLFSFSSKCCICYSNIICRIQTNSSLIYDSTGMSKFDGIHNNILDNKEVKSCKEFA